MPSSEAPYEETYACSFLEQNVRINGLLTTVTSPGGTTYIRLLTGCSGVRICRKFPTPIPYKFSQSVGCPYHEALLKG